MYLVRMKRPFKGMFYFIMSGRNWTVKEIEKKGKERAWGLLLQCAQHLGSIKTPSGESFPQAWQDGGQGSGVGGKGEEEKKRGVMPGGRVSVMMMAPPLLWPWFHRPPLWWLGWFGSAPSGSTLEMPPVPVGRG